MSDDNLPTTEQDSQKTKAPDNPIDAIGENAVVDRADGETAPKDLTMASDDNPIVQGTGNAGAHERGVNLQKLNQVLSEDMYGDESNTLRELAQNAETACLKAARLELRDHPDYGANWMMRDYWVDKETGETIADAQEYTGTQVCNSFDVEPKDIRLKSGPRLLSETVEAARDVGYDPTIEVEVYHDDRQVVVEDNGIGMTVNELENGFNETFESGSALMGDTGGMWGAGVMTIGAWMSTDGGAVLQTRTRKGNVPAYNYDGLKAYVYVGGFNPMDIEPNDEVADDDFRGTRLEIPIEPEDEGGPNLANFKGWADETLKDLRVPVQYREFRGGECVEKEEYGGSRVWERFVDDDQEPPVLIERPGEFTAFSGPDIADNIGYQGYSQQDEPNTWLVSMPIERNTRASVKSFWDVGIQIHNEQQICVAGPNRGVLKENIDDPHEDDIFTPGPTTDRDRLQQDDEQRRFFEYVSSEIAKHEMAEVSDTLERLIAADNPIEYLTGNYSEWHLFRRMVKYHGGKRVTNTFRRFAKFINSEDGLPNLHLRLDSDNNAGVDGPMHPDEEKLMLIHRLFDEIEYADSDTGHGRATTKGNRTEEVIGDILAEVPAEQLYMTKSTSGAFQQRRRVVANTYGKYGTLHLSSSQSYDDLGETFGFRKLKDVPRTQSDDHDYVVPNSVHEDAQRKSGASSSSSTGVTQQGKPDDIDERILKIRCHSKNKSVDLRWTIEQCKDRLDEKGSIKSAKPLILFPGGKQYPNISDHYDLQKYAAIASCTQEEYEAFAGYDRVYTLSEFMAASLNVVIATEEGPRRVRNLIKDDERLVLAYARNSGGNHWVKKLLQDTEYARKMRGYIVEEVKSETDFKDPRTQYDSNVETKELTPVFAVADHKTLRLAEYGFELLRSREPEWERRNQLAVMVRFTHSTPSIRWPWENCKFSKREHYEAKIETPNWRDDSSVYDIYYSDTETIKQELLKGFHDVGVDPTLLTQGEIRRLIAENISADDCHYYGDEPSEESEEETDGGVSLEDAAAERQALLFTDGGE